MSTEPDFLAPLIAQLHGHGRLRVWSLVITIFGDAIQPRGGRVSSVRLQDILGRLNIEAGALRTAMSRLAKEGWVERDKSGRRTIYRLSAKGIAEFGPATRRIYAGGVTGSKADWVLGVPAHKTGEPVGTGIPLIGGAWLWRADAMPSRDWMAKHGVIAVKGELLPLSLGAVELMAPDGLQDAYADLIRDFSPIDAGDISGLAPLDALALRVLLIHRWRRIVLRCPDVPLDLLPAGWPAQACAELVARLYCKLAPVADQWLDASLGGAVSALPPPSAQYFERFVPRPKA
jgi:phenylacetic acid degradation operon negative regulatory protein